MSERYCQECGHPESEHLPTGGCNGKMMVHGGVSCKCKEFRTADKREDFSQAAARIEKEATDNH